MNFFVLERSKFGQISPNEGRKIHKIFLFFLLFSPAKGPRVESRAAHTRQLATLVPPRGRKWSFLRSLKDAIFISEFLEIEELSNYVNFISYKVIFNFAIFYI